MKEAEEAADAHSTIVQNTQYKINFLVLSFSLDNCETIIIIVYLSI